jgi:hypothetical protein
MKWGYRSLVGALVAVALALVASGGQGSLAAARTIYVDADATGAHDGSSWADAYTGLQLALDSAVAEDDIWVAEGIYTPTQEFSPGDPRSAAFQMKNGVAIYGGFDPSIGDVGMEDRDWEANITILSGDIGTQGDDSDNSYHVFYHPAVTDLDSSAILDGFVITGGNANGDTSPHRDGGGMYNDGSSPTLINCAFSANAAIYNGGAMLNDHSSSPALTNCAFQGNSAGSGGGLYNANVSWPSLTNCTFVDNSADYGGGMFNDAFSSPSLINVTFAGNWAISGGGMFNYDASSPQLTNCTFSTNGASWEGGGIFNSNASSPVLINCILWGDTSSEIYNDDSTPVVTYSNIQGGYPGEGNIDAYPWFVDPENGDFHLGGCSPCIDRGSNLAPDLPAFDFEGDNRVLDGDGDGIAIVDMGVDEVTVVGTCFHVYLPMVLRGY